MFVNVLLLACTKYSENYIYDKLLTMLTCFSGSRNLSVLSDYVLLSQFVATEEFCKFKGVSSCPAILNRANSQTFVSVYYKFEYSPL